MKLSLPSELLSSLEAMNSPLFEDMISKDEYGLEPGDFVGRNVLDVGANIGMFSIIAAAGGGRTIVSIEPNLSNFESLFRNCHQYHNVHPLLFAVHGSSGACNTVGEGQTCTVVPDPNGTVPTITLSQALALFPPGDNDLLLKMDIEGTEFDVIYQTNGDDIRRFRTFMLEIHCRENPRKATALEDFVKALGYRIVSRKPLFLMPSWTYLGQNILKYERID